ncbi:MAG: glycosyltransferase family 4 protein [Deltaproteobacteria bacterium]|jgi:Fuc2NAc and GlcNAc transferase|nr:glycosyltransferase family 4 protein [Deltaproteobacteria bacterium]
MTKTARYTGLLDFPNQRSSHSQPTPSGGGLALVAIVLVSNLGLIWACPEFFFGGLLIAAVGLLDDMRPLPVLPRLLAQFLAVGAAVILLPSQAPIKGIPIYLVKPILFLSGVWFINVYNFMDGIDGLAGGYANAAAVGFLFCLGGGAQMVEPWSLRIYSQLVYITMPFLIFNWNPAKIFMGDTGSTFMGFVFFCLGIRGLIYGNFIMYSFIIIMSFFWIDATLTIARRFMRDRRVFRAHKEHAFHKAAAIFGHWKVSCFIICVTLFWLNPMARVAMDHPGRAPWVTALALVPIVVIILAFKPGCPIDEPGCLLRFLIRHFKSSGCS